MMKAIVKTLAGSGIIVLALYVSYWLCILVGMIFPLFHILFYGSRAAAIEEIERLAPYSYHGVYGMYFLAGFLTIAIVVLAVFVLAGILVSGNQLGHRLFQDKTQDE